MHVLPPPSTDRRSPMPDTQPIADRLEEIFMELSEGAHPTAIELTAAHALDFQAWIAECARKHPEILGEGWRFGGIPIVRIDAPLSRVICQVEFVV